jgi:hypothetical protein
MDSFDSYLFKQTYGKVGRLGDRLARVNGLIDWARAPLLRPPSSSWGT